MASQNAVRISSWLTALVSLVIFGDSKDHQCHAGELGATGLAEDSNTVRWSSTTGDATLFCPSIHHLVSIQDGPKSRNAPPMCVGTIFTGGSGPVDVYGGCTRRDLTDLSWRSVLAGGRSAVRRVGRVGRYHDAAAKIRKSRCTFLFLGVRPLLVLGGR